MSAGFFFVDFLAKTVCGVAVQCYVAVQVGGKQAMVGFYHAHYHGSGRSSRRSQGAA
ncbi:hypothetical protein BH20ACT4_BH20ACT4_13520 [soil metagenome]